MLNTYVKNSSIRKIRRIPVYKSSKVHYWIKIENQNATCSLKINQTVEVLGLKTVLRNPSEILQWNRGFKIVSRVPQHSRN